MLTLRQSIYSLVAAGSLLMAGAQALGSDDDEPIEATTIGLGQAALRLQLTPTVTTATARLEASSTS